MAEETSFDTGFIPERPGSRILHRRYYNAQTGVGGQEWHIPWKPMNLSPDEFTKLMRSAVIITDQMMVEK